MKKKVIKSEKIIKQKEKKFESGQIKDLVVAGIVLATLIAGIAITPNFPIVLAGLMKLLEREEKGPVSKHKVRRVLKDLEKKKVLRIEQKDGEAIVYIKNLFHTSVAKYSLKSLLDLKRKKKKWSGKWVLVIFDVPESQKNKRDYLRRFLSKIGFYAYQKSVYVYPYECEKEVALIKKIVEGGKYIKYVLADKIEDEPKVKRYFNLTSDFANVT